jgi:phenylalanyl-tRNA synthetase beta chain
VLGVEWPAAQVEKTLRALGFEATPSGAHAWRVRVPYWRPDVTIPEDLCEELARVIGYDNIPATVLSGRVPRWEPQLSLEVREKVRDALVAAGLQEMVSYSATSAQGEDRLRLPDKAPGHVRLQNPVSADMAVMRRTLREGVLSAVARNARLWRGPVAMFEIGKVFLDPGEGLPQEREMAVGAFLGPRSDAHWAGERGRLDFFDAKGAVEAALEALGIDGAFAPGKDGTLAAGRVAIVTSPAAGGLRLGVVGEVDEAVMAAFDIDAGPVALFELDIEALRSAAEAAKSKGSRYKPYARFPGSTRDIALLLDETAPAGEAMRLIMRNRLVSDAVVFDVFQGKGVPVGKKSLAIRITYQAEDRTLTADEVTKAEQAILFIVKKELGAELRVQ